MHFWQATCSSYMEKYSRSQNFEQKNPEFSFSSITDSPRNVEISNDHSVIQFILIKHGGKNLPASLSREGRGKRIKQEWKT